MAGDETQNISDIVASKFASNSSSSGSRCMAQAAIERANLLNMSKLCIKNLIESSLKLGRTLGEDHGPLQQFFVIFEHVLRHGLKGRSHIMQNKGKNTIHSRGKNNYLSLERHITI